MVFRLCRLACFQLPIFRDTHTPDPFIDEFSVPSEPFKSNQVYMDAMCFGMGCSCLQITFQACNIDEARFLYDQLAVLCPLMLAMTAAAPVFRGYLVDRDCRWDVISASVDDRTDEEIGAKPLENDKYRIYKSRYDSIDCYLSNDEYFDQKYNDIPMAINEDALRKLLAEGVDPPLARHVAHIFTRDPLVVYKELIHQDDRNSTDHFENIQSTNWQTMRFKPPPPNSNIGWRVEFRSMEIQLTDFENAAFAIFLVLFTRAVLSFRLNLYMPISKVDQNMKLSQKRDALNTERFSFRKQLFSPNHPGHPLLSPLMTDFGSPKADSKFAALDGGKQGNASFGSVDDECLNLSITDIFNGSEVEGFVGLIPIVDAYLSSIDIDMESRLRLNIYLDFVRQRANGYNPTPAKRIRDFVRSHPEYQKDSKLTDRIVYDLFQQIKSSNDEAQENVRVSPDTKPNDCNC